MAIAVRDMEALRRMGGAVVREESVGMMMHWSAIHMQVIEKHMVVYMYVSHMVLHAGHIDCIRYGITYESHSITCRSHDMPVT